MVNALEQLAQLAPLALAGFGKRTETADRVMEIQEKQKQLDEKERVKRAGREIIELSVKDPNGFNADAIMAVAKKYDAPFEPLMNTMVAFKKFQKMGQPEPQVFSKMLEDGRVLEAKLTPEEAKAAQFDLFGSVKGERTPDPKLYAGEDAYGIPDYENQRMIPFAGLKPKVGGSTSVSIGNITAGGNMPLAKPVVPAMQKDVIYGMDASARLAEIEKRFKPEMLTYMGKAKNAANIFAEKAGMQLDPETKKQVRDMTGFRTSVEQNFNQYRKEITGAAASVQELDRLKKSMFNADMSPTEFEAAFDTYKKEAARVLRLKRAILRSGLPVGTEEFGNQLDSAFLGGAQANSDQDADARGYELEQQGLTPEEVTEKLIEEGYIDAGDM